ncbi:MAG: hypothetical protein Q8K45_20055 [Rubrivivax sp.]|nr:hypothetical protein [Rubrivivax sp.]
MATQGSKTPGTQSTGAALEIYERGSGGQGDVLVETRLLTSAPSAADLEVGATRYAVVRAPTEAEAKTIDNWSQTPPPAGDS